MATLDEARAAKAAAGRRWPGAAVGVCPDGAGGHMVKVNLESGPVPGDRDVDGVPVRFEVVGRGRKR